MKGHRLEGVEISSIMDQEHLLPEKGTSKNFFWYFSCIQLFHWYLSFRVVGRNPIIAFLRYIVRINLIILINCPIICILIWPHLVTYDPSKDQKFWWCFGEFLAIAENTEQTNMSLCLMLSAVIFRSLCYQLVTFSV